jgi:DNA polymerase-1
VNPTRPAEALGAVAYDYLEAETPPLVKGGAPDAGAAAAAVNQIASLRAVLEPRLSELELTPLFHDLEMPLIPVLIEMEQSGVAVDLAALAQLSKKLGARAAELEKQIHAIAGEEFNISSPQQLRRVLFEKLGLPPDKSKRTKSGYSTAAEVLTALGEHEIVAKILEYREVTKLKSTYVEALPPLVNPRTGRLHTSLNQAVTATGRLSSTNPNLQNIPARTPAGMEIRRAFVTGAPDRLLLSADYSQIELRVLAHITGDDNLIEVFLRDEDLHRAAAMEIFGVGPEGVTPQMRAFAKMVNFGIPYGISDFRLSREMGISLEEARRYMSRYFARFPKVHEYVQQTPAQARERGYVTTLLGRRRPIPELRSRAPAVRQAAERVAINTPMQGSAADIMKLAMLRVHEELQRRQLGGRMILQVHDELLLETPEGELHEAAALVEASMGNAYQLRVPLKVEVKAGRNWLEMHRVG